MTTTSESHGHSDVDRSTDEVHHNSWSANLEAPIHADDRDRLRSEARQAIRNTAPGYHVNLVTHGEQGHPSEFLFEALAEAFDDSVEWEYVKQCGCGGHVTRVHVG
jgi:putative CGCGG family rSAM target protein